MCICGRHGRNLQQLVTDTSSYSRSKGKDRTWDLSTIPWSDFDGRLPGTGLCLGTNRRRKGTEWKGLGNVQGGPWWSPYVGYVNLESHRRGPLDPEL